MNPLAASLIVARLSEPLLTPLVAATTALLADPTTVFGAAGPTVHVAWRLLSLLLAL